jgi:hypothetical protein
MECGGRAPRVKTVPCVFRIMEGRSLGQDLCEKFHSGAQHAATLGSAQHRSFPMAARSRRLSAGFRPPPDNWKRG